MEYTSELREMNDRFWLLLTEDVILSKAILGILCLAAVYFLAFSLYKWARRRWDSLYFALLSAFVLAWAGCSLWALFVPGSAAVLNTVGLVGLIPIPMLLCLHVQRQVSYKELRVVPTILLGLIPALLLFVICHDLLFPAIFPDLPLIGETNWYHILYGIYTAVALIRAYVLCFSVFYQMPKRTRRSTRYMLVGVSSISLWLAINALWSAYLSVLIPHSDALGILSPLLAPSALLVVLYALFNALYVMPASEVIVTSREFVVGGLSTTILILNRREEILDWNRTDWESGYPLLRPRFREPIAKYRARMLEQKVCRVSPHSEDILIAKQDDAERHFLLRTHEARNSKRLFGYVLEISEITQIYTLMRYFEQIARYDQLTGLFNRNAYINRAEHISQDNNLPLLIIVGDVNLLKHVNDVHGHILGDELLTAVSGVIKQAMPEDAFAARVGGDEFVLLISNGSIEMAEQFIQTARTMCGEIHHEVFGSPSISWGYAVMTSNEQNYDEVFAEADAMMYADKKSHRKFSSSGLLHNK